MTNIIIVVIAVVTLTFVVRLLADRVGQKSEATNS